jgi:hypothetical protein
MWKRENIFARTVEKSLAVITRSLLPLAIIHLVKRFVFRAAFGAIMHCKSERQCSPLLHSADQNAAMQDAHNNNNNSK